MSPIPRTRNDRGFSLLVVLLVAVVLAVVGSSAVLVATRDAGTAGARAMRVQALAAAEAGLAHFQQMASPSLIEDGTYYVGRDTGDANTDYRWLPQVPGRNGEMLDARYRVRGGGPGPLPKTGLAIVEGEVLSGGRVVGRAELSVLVKAAVLGGSAGRNQEDHSEAGGNADGVIPTTAISLEGGAFDG